MKRLKWLVLIAIAVVAFMHYRSHSAPSSSDVESALRAYLSSPEAQNCSGTMTLDQLDDVRVGAYQEQFGGWPVYAAHRETCRGEQHSSGYSSRVAQTYDGSRDAERNVAVAFARRSMGGGVELFVPGLFGEGERQMRETIQKSLEKVHFNVQSGPKPST
ncbi:MAG TPA: hypothetical protein VH111_00020 [Steroidobacteraceae bacterium]|jgi:hypothetical protein|nr:hypothetical protein [Steroidobacteraceae bacterium]